MDFIDDTQRVIVLDDARTKLVQGCAGSRKTDTLVKIGVHHARAGRSVLFLTLVGSVTSEICGRLRASGFPLERVGTANHYETPGADGEAGGSQERKDPSSAPPTPPTPPVVVGVANFDAFVHRQLQHLGLHDQLVAMGDRHDWKTAMLCQAAQEGQHTCFVMKGGSLADVVLIDEFQDLCPMKARVVTHILRRNPAALGVAVGDVMQTLFSRSVLQEHPMNVWRAAFAQGAEYAVDTCWRCPPEHIALANRLLGGLYTRFGARPLRPAARPSAAPCPPVLFTHGRTTTNHGAYIIAEQVAAAVEALMRHDPTLGPGDVAVVMKRSNGNHVYEQLKITLSRTYTALGHAPGSVVHFETRGDGVHVAIDWASSAGKTVLLSIHGDKGKGHRVVFFLGFTARSLPAEANLFKSEELMDASLANVALTRSTQHLFVGFSGACPSRYVACASEHLGESAVLAWDAPRWACGELTPAEGGSGPGPQVPPPPSPYREAVEAMRARVEMLVGSPPDAPEFDRAQRADALACPARSIVCARTDLAGGIAALGLPAGLPEPEVVRFGQAVRLHKAPPAELAPVFGLIGELLVARHMHLYHDHPFLRRTFSTAACRDIEYTDDHRVLNLIADAGLNRQAHEPTSWWGTLRRLREEHAVFMQREHDVGSFFAMLEARGAAGKPSPVASRVFSGEAFRKQLGVFLSRTESEQISTRVFWNVALYYSELCGPSFGQDVPRRPMAVLLLDRFAARVDGLHANVRAFCDAYLAPPGSPAAPTVPPFPAAAAAAAAASSAAAGPEEDDDPMDIDEDDEDARPAREVHFHVPHRLVHRETDADTLRDLYGFVDHADLDADRFRRGYVYGIHGRSDVLVADGGEGRALYGLKTATSGNAREWLAQALAHACVPSCSSTKEPWLLPRTCGVADLIEGVVHVLRVPPEFAHEQMLSSALASGGFTQHMIDRLIERHREHVACAQLATGRGRPGSPAGSSE